MNLHIASANKYNVITFNQIKTNDKTVLRGIKKSDIVLFYVFSHYTLNKLYIHILLYIHLISVCILLYSKLLRKS